MWRQWLVRVGDVDTGEVCQALPHEVVKCAFGDFHEQWAGAFGQACFAVQGMQGDVAGECVEEEL